MTETPARYRQRPIEAEAVQWTGHNADALRAFAGIDFDTIDPADRIEDPDQDAQLLVEASHWVGIRPGDWVLKFEGYFVAKSDVPFRAVWEPAASAAVPSAPAARAALREQIAAAIAEQFTPDGKTTQGMRVSFQGPDGWPATRQPNPSEVTDAVLAVLPAPADRAAILREAADALVAVAAQHLEARAVVIHWGDAAALLRTMAQEECDELEAQAHLDELADDLYRMADEAQQPETRAIQCADAFWDGQPHAPHDWQQRPDTPPVRCPGIVGAQQPKEA